MLYVNYTSIKKGNISDNGTKWYQCPLVWQTDWGHHVWDTLAWNVQPEADCEVTLDKLSWGIFYKTVLDS